MKNFLAQLFALCSGGLVIALVFSACDDIQPDPPTPVMLHQPEVLQDTVVVSWTQANTEDFSNYILVWDTTESLLEVTTNRHVFDDQQQISDSLSGLAFDITYFLKVLVQESDGDSAGSNIVSVNLPEPIPAHTPEPVQLGTPGVIGFTIASLSWSPTLDSNFVFYEVLLDTTLDFQSPWRHSDAIISQEDSVITYNDLQPDTRYYFQVWTYYSDSDSVGSTVLEFMTLSVADLAPVAITGVEQVDGGAVLVTWNQWRAENFLAYEIYLDEGDSLEESFFRVATHEFASDSSYTFTELQADRLYFSRIVLNLDKGDHVTSAVVPFSLVSRYENQIRITDAEGIVETDLEDIFYAFKP